MNDADEFYCILTPEEWSALFNTQGSKVAILRIAEAALAFCREGVPKAREILRRLEKWVVRHGDLFFIAGPGVNYWTPRVEHASEFDARSTAESYLPGAQRDFPEAAVARRDEPAAVKKAESSSEAWARTTLSYLREQGNQVSDQSKIMLSGLFNCAMLDERERTLRERPDVYVLKKEGCYLCHGWAPDGKSLERAMLFQERDARDRLNMDDYQGFTMVSYYDELNKAKS